MSLIKNMLQPKWSQVVDTEAPDAVMKGLELVWNCTAVGFPEHSPIDYLIARDGDVRAIIEFRNSSKLESNAVHEFPLSKLQAALTTSDKLKISLFLVARFRDGLFFVHLGSLNYPPSYHPHDDETYLQIPVASFQPVTV